MKEKNFENILYSSAGVAGMFVLLLAFYVLTSAVKVRADLTAEKAYTLSPGTRHILSKLDAPVTLRYYCSQADMPPELKPFTQEIEDLLEEYKQAGNGKIILQKLDPKPDSDAEDSARLDGIQGAPLTMGGDQIYLGLSVSRMDTKVAIPSWLDMSRERLLEYDISRAITRVVNPEPVVVGVMSALPVMGEQPDELAARMGRSPGGSAPWVFVSELQQDFTVREVPMTTEQIDPDIKVLLVYHPRGITPAAQFAIDQFIMRGGKVVAFLDPHAYSDQKNDQLASMLGDGASQSSLPLLLPAWGLGMDDNKVVADRNDCVPNYATILQLTKTGINHDDIATSELDNLQMLFAGALTGKPADGLTETVLVHSSTNSQLVEGLTVLRSNDEIVKNFAPSGVEYNLAVRLTGKFKTAFPAGKPKAPTHDTNDLAPTNDEVALKESPPGTSVILVSDMDMLADQFCANVTDFLGRRMVSPKNGNLNFTQSCIEQMAGDNDLITLRSRGSLSRPFTRLQALEANAGKQWQDKLKELEAKRQEAEQKISELQSAKQGGGQQQFVLSPEQQKELESYQKATADTGKELRQVQKNLRKDTDALQNWIKVINIGAMPALVALTGVVLSVVKRKKTAAQ